MARVINNSEFENEVLRSSGVVLVDFFAEWCGPCKMISPILDELSLEMEGKLNIFKVDIDKSGELALKYNVMAVPTMIIFKNGKEIDKVMGFLPKSTLKAKLDYFNN